eukprot:13397347-Alexandrium_andersonii.AAC.1
MKRRSGRLNQTVFFAQGALVHRAENLTERCHTRALASQDMYNKMFARALLTSFGTSPDPANSHNETRPANTEPRKNVSFQHSEGQQRHDTGTCHLTTRVEANAWYLLQRTITLKESKGPSYARLIAKL